MGLRRCDAPRSIAGAVALAIVAPACADPAATAPPAGTSESSGAAASSGAADGGSTASPDPDPDTTGVGSAPGPWDAGWPIPAEPQTEGNPEAGWIQLVHAGYVSCGIPMSMWPLVSPFLGAFVDGDPLPGRSGEAASMPYNWNIALDADGVKIASQNCLTCHGGYFNGELVVGLGNAHTDFTERFDQLLSLVPTPDLPAGDLGAMSKFLDRLKALGPYTAMRTIGTNPAEAMAVTLVAHRDRHTLAWSDEPLEPLPEIIVPSDPPPWWRAHKKNALFYNAMARGDHRGTMMLASSLCTDTIEEATMIASYFDDIHAYVRSVRAPAYPFAIDAALAATGEGIFVRDCAGCHGTYGATEDDDTYPNLLFPLDVIGTDPVVAEGGTVHAPHMVQWYNESFYGEITRMEPDDPFVGYAAPPLDGVWATGPFLHNGSVPSIALVLDSTRRPTYWRRVDYDSANFDEKDLGWPWLAVDHGHDGLAPAEAKYIYDTTQFAHDNGGHTFGDHLDDDERTAVLEYLKTL